MGQSIGSGSAPSSASSSVSGTMGIRPAKRAVTTTISSSPIMNATVPTSNSEFVPTLQVLMMQLFGEVVRARYHAEDASQDSFEEEGGRLLSEAFMLVPSKSIYPDYYEVIREPLDLRMVAMRLAEGRYQHLDELERDLQLMLKNARTYNEPKSQLYMDATTLSRLVRTRKTELVDIWRRLSAVVPQPVQRPEWWRDDVENVVNELRVLPMPESPPTPGNASAAELEEEEDEGT